MSNFTEVLSQYELLAQTAQYISTLDLFHLASTCSQLYTLIRKSENVFQRLQRNALCDDHGLIERQEPRGKFYSVPMYEIRGVPRPEYDEEIEVRVWNRQCDSTNGLPCLRCGVNVCEECRFVPRVRDRPNGQSNRRPHLNVDCWNENLICYCSRCDEGVERGLPLRISKYCDCDQYKRWICLYCKKKEDDATKSYYDTCVKYEDYEASPEGGEAYFWDTRFMWLHNHQHPVTLLCPCGTRVLKDDNVRCAWCKRKHNRKTWMKEDPGYIPYFDEDPCHPHHPQMGNHPRQPYRNYTGPIAP